MADKATVWELYQKAERLTESQRRIIIMLIDEFLKKQGGN